MHAYVGVYMHMWVYACICGCMHAYVGVMHAYNKVDRTHFGLTKRVLSFCSGGAAFRNEYQSCANAANNTVDPRLLPSLPTCASVDGNCVKVMVCVCLFVCACVCLCVCVYHILWFFYLHLIVRNSMLTPAANKSTSMTPTLDAICPTASTRLYTN